MVNIAVFVSGGGTNLQALIDAQHAGRIENGKLALVVSSNPEAFALTRAEKAGVETAVMRRRDYASSGEYAGALAGLLSEKQIGLIVLAGFMTVLPDSFCKTYENRIINVHPSLHVHEAALAKGVKVSGATVHFVSGVVDGGPIIAQKAVEVAPDDTPETLQKRIMHEAEWVLLPRAVSDFCAGRLTVDGTVVKVR